MKAVAAAGVMALLVTACTELDDIPKHLRPLPNSVQQLIEKKGMKDTAPILVRIFKDESVLEVWKKQTATGRYALLKSYEICKWSGVLGPKKQEGDRQAPEGFYAITPAQLNPNSNYHLSFNLGFPNAYDQSLGRTGTYLMVHGACSSAGCYSMTDEQIQEIYTLARLAFQGGQRSFQVQALPFRMTPENMAKYRKNENMPFWRMLKVGYDHFEVTGQEPKVDVCASQYVFNAVPEGGMSFRPTANCPPLSIPEPIRIAVTEKAAKDEAKAMIIAAKLEAEEKANGGEVLPSAPATMMAGLAAPAAVPAGPMSTAPAAAPMRAAAPVASARAVEPDLQTASITPASSVAPVAAGPATVPTAVPQAVATAYAPAREEKRGFFARVLAKVNPF